jgi:MFS family permease
MPARPDDIAIARSEPLFALLALTTAVQALATFSVFALPTLAPKAAVAFGVAPQWIGYQVSVIYIAAALMSGYAGVIVRRYGPCTASLAALAICICGLLGLSTGTMAITVAGSALIGIGYGLTNPAAAQLLFKYAPPGRRNLIFAIKQAGVPIGGMIAASVLPRLSESIGWQGAIAASTLAFAFVAVPLWDKRARWDEDADPNAGLNDGALAGLTLVWQNELLRSLAFTGLCFAGFQVCLIAFAVTMLATEFGWTLVEAGLIAALMQVAGITGRLIWSLAADRFGQGLTILSIVGSMATVFALATSVMTPAWPTTALVLVLFGFGFSIIGWNGVYMAQTARISGSKDVGIATGGVLMFNFAGVIVAPASFGLISKTTGSIAATFGLFALLPLVGTLLLLWAIRRDRISKQAG